MAGVIAKMAMLAAPVAAFYAFDNTLEVNSHQIFTNKINTSIRAVILADLHSTVYGEKQHLLAKLVKLQNPDIILMPGDIIHESRPFFPVEDLVRKITTIAPVYFSMGNHECRPGKIHSAYYNLRRLEKLGVTTLHDRYEAIEIKGEKIIIAGIRDPEYSRLAPGYRQMHSMRKAFANIGSESGYKILLAHRPEFFAQYAKYLFDLVVSGHAHGGQVRIPMLDVGLYSHGKIFPKYTSGLHSMGGTQMLVSRGLSRFNFLPRIYNPPEILTVTIKGNKQNNK